MMNRFEFLKTYFSPFKPLKPKFYIGKVAIGVPIFYPRKKIGFDFRGLFFKTKWSDTDFRFEYSPVWSFVFFGWQIAIIWKADYLDHYWECWLLYHLATDKNKTTKERIKQAREINPQNWQVYNNGVKEDICYWEKVLKNKYL